MEKLPIYLILLIVYLVAASGGKKKKRQQREASAAAKPGKNAERKRARSERKEERARRERTAQTEKGFAAAFAPERPAQTSAAASGVVSGQKEKADRLADIPEGEDLCHPERGEETPGGTQWLDMDRVQAAGHAPEQERSLPGEEVLRGIIMSEILTRPCERRARNRRGYHG